jgi:hypothetical protein
MQLQLFAPGNDPRNQHGEGHHVIEGNAQKGRIGLLTLNGIEPAHDDGDCAAQRDHQYRESGAKPAKEAVPLQAARTHQRRLKDVEGHPSREC